jgi:nicotinamidase-related amidase
MFLSFRLVLAIFLVGSKLTSLNAEPLRWSLRYQTAVKPGSDRYHQLQREETWLSEQTALIVCDMWDLHHCHRAVVRGKELAPRLNEVVQQARKLGVTIIHAPSSCVDHYANHPARKRAMGTPRAKSFPPDISRWCHKIPAEESGKYPIDQSNGGEDDDREEHAKWQQELVSLGRNPKAPWKKQSDTIEIDGQGDFISDNGEEIWSILESRGITNVILTGVHTNMCVLGRPFGLRQMVRAGKRTALMRDMTDTMYDPNCWPFVSHFSGTDLIIDHIERHICATITSDQLIGGQTFRFAEDKRPTVAIVMSESEYETATTLPLWSASHLAKNYRVQLIYGSESDPNSIPGIEAIAQANLLLVSVRRRTLPPEQLNFVRKFVATKKPVLGIRTASHAFSLRNTAPPQGLAAWPEFDAEVFGGNYINHFGNDLHPTIGTTEAGTEHEITGMFHAGTYVSQGSLYQTSPLQQGALALLKGEIDGKPAEPAAWLFRRSDGGQSFYTSLGHKSDFADARFQAMLLAAVEALLK